MKGLASYDANPYTNLPLVYTMIVFTLCYIWLILLIFWQTQLGILDLSLSDWLLNKAEANKSKINNNKFKLGKKSKEKTKGKRLQLKKDNRLLALIRLRFNFFQTSCFWTQNAMVFFFDLVHASHTHEKVVAKPGTTAEHCLIALIT